MSPTATRDTITATRTATIQNRKISKLFWCQGAGITRAFFHSSNKLLQTPDNIVTFREFSAANIAAISGLWYLVQAPGRDRRIEGSW
jgi:hypothetical protein